MWPSDGVICVAGTSSVVPSASASVTVVQPSIEVQGENNKIAYTGVNTMALLAIALLLLGGGAIVLGLGTARRSASALM